MNPFEKHSIGPRPKKTSQLEKAERWLNSHRLLSIVALILGLFTLRGVFGAIQDGNPFSVKQIFLSAVGEGLKEDALGHTNILLLGVGGEGHDGENLTDTMIVASIDTSDNTLSMLSLPRDLYVENERVGWGTRINSIYEYIYDETEDPEIAEAELEKEIESIVGVEIHYYAKIDFKGFTELIDAMGGITIDVANSISDPAYPALDGSGQTYDPFYLSAGTQTFDGETALKYVRSRHDSSDFDRASRQQEVITAIKDKALSMGVLTSPSKIEDVYSVVASNFETNMSISELVTLVGQGSDFDSSSIQSAVLNDLAYTTGGFLYTPEREEGDPYYLVPYAGPGDFSEIARFAQLFFYHPEIMRDQVTITVLNGTKAESLAGLTKMFLVRYGFTVADYGNAETKEVTKTQIYNQRPESEEVENTAKLIPLLIDGELTADIPLAYQSTSTGESYGQGELFIELGQDFAEYYKEHEDLFYIGFY